MRPVGVFLFSPCFFPHVVPALPLGGRRGGRGGWPPQLRFLALLPVIRRPLLAMIRKLEGWLTRMPERMAIASALLSLRPRFCSPPLVGCRVRLSCGSWNARFAFAAGPGDIFSSDGSCGLVVCQDVGVEW